MIIEVVMKARRASTVGLFFLLGLAIQVRAEDPTQYAPLDPNTLQDQAHMKPKNQHFSTAELNALAMQTHKIGQGTVLGVSPSDAEIIPANTRPQGDHFDHVIIIDTSK